MIVATQDCLAGCDSSVLCVNQNCSISLPCALSLLENALLCGLIASLQAGRPLSPRLRSMRRWCATRWTTQSLQFQDCPGWEPTSGVCTRVCAQAFSFRHMQFHMQVGSCASALLFSALHLSTAWVPVASLEIPSSCLKY